MPEDEGWALVPVADVVVGDTVFVLHGDQEGFVWPGYVGTVRAVHEDPVSQPDRRMFLAMRVDSGEGTCWIAIRSGHMWRWGA